MAKEMLINVSEGEECRIAILEDGRLDELYMERTSSTSHVGNIYKGRVTNVEPSIQAAFVDFGLGRNGFLHISDLMPTYFGRKGEDIVETVGKKMSRRDRPPIQRCLRRGDEIVVQIIKEGIGTKGPTLSTYLSIPGRILVMMPGMGKMGVSKKIEDDVERRRLRQILDGLKPPKDVGFIIRTAGIGKSKAEIERDLKYLTRLWETLEKKRVSGPGPTELYTEGDLVTRTVRDLFTSDVDRIVIDSKDVAKRVKEVIKITAPRSRNRVDIYEEPVPLFHQYGIEREIEQMYSRHVPLPSGGSLVIDSTEAIVAIDVNSGKFRDHSDAEMTAFKIDMEAADEITRQLKLRDLGGVIIVDFIDLRYERHRRDLEEKLHENLKRDRAKTKVLRMSQFGIIEMTRQRMRPSLKRSVYFDCPHCKGAGLVKTPESMSLDVMRKLAMAANDQRVQRIELSVCPDVSYYLLNRKRAQLAAIEDETKKGIVVRTDQTLALDEMKVDLYDARDGVVFVEELGLAIAQPPHRSQLSTRPVGAPRQGGRLPQGGGRSDDRRRGQPERRPPQGQPPRGQARRGQQPAPESRHDEDDLDERDEATEALQERIEGDDTENGDVQVQRPEPARDSARDQDHPRSEAQRSGPAHGQPNDQNGEGGGQRRRRRRGRRGRGRGRGNEGQPSPQGQGQPIDDEQDRDEAPQPGRGPAPQHQPQRSQANERGIYESVGEDEVDEDLVEPLHAQRDDERPGPAPAAIDDRALSQQEEADDEGDAAGNVAEGAESTSDAPKRRRRRGGRGRGRGRKPKSPTTAAAEPEEATEAEIVEPEEPAPEEEAPAEVNADEAEPPARKRRRRGGRGREKGKATAEGATPVAAAAKPSRSAASASKKALTAKEAKEVAKTGSTDRHIVDDEPVDPEPPPRLVSRRDLDDIVGDYDE